MLRHLCVAFAVSAIVAGVELRAALVPVGVARVDVTPELPIRLSGYQNRATEASEVKARLFARAMAIGGDDEQPAVLITVDLIGVAESFSDAVAAALARSHRIDRSRVAICVTHTHTGPAVAGVLPFMFSRELPEDETARIERYTENLQAKLVAVARAALANRKPAQLAWGEGSVGFAGQRRTIVNGKWTGFGHDPNGSVDRSLPVLRVTDERGGVRAVFTSYACHCTTLTGRENFVHGDWAGDAAVKIEATHPGAVGLIAIGCGADANPATRGSLEHVTTNANALAAEVERVLAGKLRPLGAVTTARYRSLPVPLDHAVTREELQARIAANPRQQQAYAAAKFLEQLEAGRPLPTTVPLPLQTWTFGNDLAMVFIGGEVVSQYSLRLRRELDGPRLWVNAYANSVPCYVPAKSMFSEGGYEVDGSMDYYGWPTRLAIGTEDQIIAAVREMLPAFVAHDRRTSANE